MRRMHRDCDTPSLEFFGITAEQAVCCKALCVFAYCLKAPKSAAVIEDVVPSPLFQRAKGGGLDKLTPEFARVLDAPHFHPRNVNEICSTVQQIRTHIRSLTWYIRSSSSATRLERSPSCEISAGDPDRRPTRRHQGSPLPWRSVNHSPTRAEPSSPAPANTAEAPCRASEHIQHDGPRRSPDHTLRVLHRNRRLS